MAGIVKKRRILTKEEEFALFKTMRDENASPEARRRAEETIVLKNWGLVVKEAKRWATNGAVSFDDLQQEGAKGLVRAIRKFDLSMGKKFSTYATWWIKRDVGRLARTGSDVIHVPEHTYEAARIARARIAKFEAENGRRPTDDEFESVAGVTREKAEEAFQAVQKTASLHAPVGDEDGSEFGDLIEDQTVEEPGAEIARAEGRALLARSLRKLAPEERMLLSLRYGVSVRPMTPESVAKAFGVPEDEMVREAERLGIAGGKAEPGENRSLTFA